MRAGQLCSSTMSMHDVTSSSNRASETRQYAFRAAFASSSWAITPSPYRQNKVEYEMVWRFQKYVREKQKITVRLNSSSNTILGLVYISIIKQEVKKLHRYFSYHSVILHISRSQPTLEMPFEILLNMWEICVSY